MNSARALLKIGHFAVFVMVVGAAIVALHAAIHLYFVVSGFAKPGDPIYLDELARPVSDSSITIGICAVLIAVGVVASLRIRRELTSHAL